MSAHDFQSKNPYGLSDKEKWHLDEVIMKYWDAVDNKEKKKIELDCYKQFKWMGFKNAYLDYLSDNGCEELAGEMKHFSQIYQKVPHEHEKQRFVA